MSATTAGTLTQARRKPLKLSKVLGRGIFYLLVVVILAYILFPFYWAARTSFMPDSDIYLTPVQYWPQNFTVQHYINAFAEPTGSCARPADKLASPKHDLTVDGQ